MFDRAFPCKMKLHRNNIGHTTNCKNNSMQIFGRLLVSPKSKILAKTKDFRNPYSRKFTYLGMVSAQLSTSEIEHYFKCFQVSDQKRLYLVLCYGFSKYLAEKVFNRISGNGWFCIYSVKDVL